MQLLLLLLLLSMGGKGGDLNGIKPILESVGGEEVSKALKEAEELSSVISAVGALTGQNSPLGNMFGGTEGVNDKGGGQTERCDEKDVGGFPLAPIADIADDGIKSSLSRYIAVGD